MASFKIASSSMENIELYFIDKNNINKEIPITTVNGIATVDLGTLPTGTWLQGSSQQKRENTYSSNQQILCRNNQQCYAIRLELLV